MSFFDPQCEHEITGIDLAKQWSDLYRKWFPAFSVSMPHARILVEMMGKNLAEHRKECTV